MWLKITLEVNILENHPVLSNRWAVSLFIFLTVFIYFWNIWFNDIWIPNEAFYAESAREMLENHNFLDIYYNYEPRFNKPPMTYWMIAFSYLLFDINEFATRLPVVLSALGTDILIFFIARELYGKSVAVFSTVVMAFSFQFVINSRYASPEVPLTFFFTLTLYLFLIGYKRNSWKYIFLSYISLGLTVLTKGFPYIFVIGAIVLLYLLIDSNFNLHSFWRKFLFLKLHTGIPVVLLVGFSWYMYMYLKFGDTFLDVTLQETVKRAIGKQVKSIWDYFFYIPVILWGFLPYSLTFFYGLLHSLKVSFKKHSFILSWFIVMFIIFTVARGKIPVYLIQAHGAMSILVGYYLYSYRPSVNWQKILYISSFIIPVILISLLDIAIIYFFKLDYMYYIFAVFPVVYIFRYKDVLLAPFISMLLTFFIFTISILPLVEKYRPYDRIGQIINDNVPEKNIPLIVEGYFWHNLPFYAKRKVLRDYSIEEIVKYSKNKTLLALVTENGLSRLKDVHILWSGRLYRKGSESRFAVFLKYIYKAIHGDYSGFEVRYLVLKR